MGNLGWAREEVVWNVKEGIDSREISGGSMNEDLTIYNPCFA